MDFKKRNNNPTNIKRVTYDEHMALHYAYMEGALHRPDVKQKSIETKRTAEYRERAREKSLEKRELFSANAKKQWEDESYKEFMVKAFLHFRNNNTVYRKEADARLHKQQAVYWANHANRDKQAERVRNYFDEHPQFRQEYSERSKVQWTDPDLLAWRSETTKMQWTPEFREKRKLAYNATYLQHGLRVLHEIYLKFGKIDYAEYDNYRKKIRDKNLLRVATLRDRFFSGDDTRLAEAVANFNHRIVRIETLKEKIDVYDIEIPGTHNFALASGVFVHNSSKQGRDRRTQAILPLKGKILNVERARLDKMLASVEIRSLVVALGTAIGDAFDISRLRYHKIIIATDADVDGAHIRTLLLTLFFRYFRQLIDGGFIYIAQPPLYKIKKGKEIFYFYNEEDKTKFVKKEAGDISEIQEVDEVRKAEEVEEVKEAGDEDEKDKKKTAKLSLQRYKGLGEMNPEELWETTMDPARRILKKVSIEDAEDADRVFVTLMGTDVPARKSFIQSNAKLANIDI